MYIAHTHTRQFEANKIRDFHRVDCRRHCWGLIVGATIGTLSRGRWRFIPPKTMRQKETKRSVSNGCRPPRQQWGGRSLCRHGHCRSLPRPALSWLTFIIALNRRGPNQTAFETPQRRGEWSASPKLWTNDAYDDFRIWQRSV